MTGAFNNMNKDNVLIYFLYIHLIFYKKYMIESLESRLKKPRKILPKQINKQINKDKQITALTPIKQTQPKTWKNKLLSLCNLNINIKKKPNKQINKHKNWRKKERKKKVSYLLYT